MQVGAGEVLDYVKRFGFDTSEFPRNTQLAIGGGTMGVTPTADGPRLRDVRQRRLSGRSEHPQRSQKHGRRSRSTRPTIRSSAKTARQPAPTPTTNEAAPRRRPRRSPSDAPDSRAARHRRRQRFHHEFDAAGRDQARHRDSREAASIATTSPAKPDTTNEADTWFNGYQKNLVAQRCGSDSATIDRSATTNTGRTRRYRSGWTS